MSVEATVSQRPRMRPLFVLPLRVQGPAVLDAIRRGLGAPGVRIEGVVLKSQAELTTRRKEAHFWSPYLSVEMTQTPDGAWALHGRFAPEPNVWILFMGLYGILGMGALGGVMYGLSEVLVGQRPYGLAVGAAFVALMGFTYGAAFIGQGLGAEEMYRLRSFVDDCVEVAARVEGPADDPQI